MYCPTGNLMRTGHSNTFSAEDHDCDDLSYFQASREQLAIAEFAQSLLVIPKQLAINAAQDSTDLVAKLRAFHNTSQTRAEHNDLRW